MKKELCFDEKNDVCFCVSEACDHHDECDLDFCEFAEREHCHFELHEVAA